MGKLHALLELLSKGLLASYLLLFAFEIHHHPLRFAPLIAHNLNFYAEVAGQAWEWTTQVDKYLLNYAQMLVLMSLAVVCGTRFGKIFAWIVVLLNLALTWNKTELLYTGNVKLT
jgi:hypothetical protein